MKAQKIDGTDYAAWKTIGGKINVETLKYVACGKTQPEPSSEHGVSESPKDIYL